MTGEQQTRELYWMVLFLLPKTNLSSTMKIIKYKNGNFSTILENALLHYHTFLC